MGQLTDAGLAIATPFVEMWNSFIEAFPGVVAAILILVLGYLVGALIGSLIEKILEKTHLMKNIVKNLHLQGEVGKWNFSELIGLIVKWYIFIVFLNPAAQVVRLSTLSTFLSTVALWIPNIILAIIIVMAGYIFAEYLGQKIKETRAKKKSFMASMAKLVTWVFIILIALRQIGVNITVAENSFLIILAGVMLGLAIAFGFGFKDEAKGLVKNLKKNL